MDRLVVGDRELCDETLGSDQRHPATDTGVVGAFDKAPDGPFTHPL